MKKVTKAVIPAAGFGTRFLPQTKAMPKEMMPIVDKPIVQRVVEELVDAGITDIIIVTGYHKRGIEDHFDDPNLDLIANLKMGGPKKEPLLKMVQEISSMANFYYVRQKGPYGNGTPLLNVRHMLGEEPFLYKWSDDFIDTENNPSAAKQLIETYYETGGSVMAGIKAKSDADYSKYGFAAGNLVKPGLIDVNDYVEKPGKDNAPSDLGIVSCWLFTPEILNFLDDAVKSTAEGQELYLADIVRLLYSAGNKVYAKEILGGEFVDTGDKLEYLKAQIKYGVRNPDLGDKFKDYLKEFVKTI